MLSRTGIDLHFILSFPITEVPLSLSHADGSFDKTVKSSLTKLLESKVQMNRISFPQTYEIDAILIDGGLILHEILPRHSSSSYGKINIDIMVKVSSVMKDAERMQRVICQMITAHSI